MFIHRLKTSLFTSAGESALHIAFVLARWSEEVITIILS